jgi:sugar/nucleoside kinase (ribokinase family)
MKHIYCYGLVELSSIYTLSGKFPAADSYKEVENVIEVPGGEAANAAVVLRRLGLKTRIAGTWLGKDVYHKVKAYFDAENVDTTPLELKKKYSGPKDMVFVSSEGRTVFGWFGKLWFQGRKWSIPKEKDIKNCIAAAIDPFMGKQSEMAARFCLKHKKPYVTIDEKPDLYIIKNADAVVLSGEFLDREFPGADIKKLMKEYTEKCRGLIIMTFGNREIIYAKKGEFPVSFKPYKVCAVDTLGAGDTFRAGVVYGIYKKMEDEEIISFAAALAAKVCMSGPGVTKSPSLKELQTFISKLK